MLRRRPVELEPTRPVGDHQHCVAEAPIPDLGGDVRTEHRAATCVVAARSPLAGARVLEVCVAPPDRVASILPAEGEVSLGSLDATGLPDTTTSGGVIGAPANEVPGDTIPPTGHVDLPAGEVAIAVEDDGERRVGHGHVDAQPRCRSARLADRADDGRVDAGARLALVGGAEVAVGAVRIDQARRRDHALARIAADLTGAARTARAAAAVVAALLAGAIGDARVTRATGRTLAGPCAGAEKGVAALVGHPVAIVVDTIAHLLCPGVDLGRSVVAVTLERRKTVEVSVVRAIRAPGVRQLIRRHLVGFHHRARIRVLGGVAVAVQVADVADVVGVVVGLVRVREQGAVVGVVLDAVVVLVLIARVADVVGVRIELVRIRDERAVVRTVEDPVVVIIGVDAVGHRIEVLVGEPLVDRAAAVVVDPVAHLRRPVMNRGVEGCAVRGVEVPVVVVVGVARIAESVAVGVELVRVGDERAVVHVVEHAVAVRVVHARISALRIRGVGRSGAAVVGVRLRRVRDVQAVVAAVVHAVAIEVGVARVADAVAIRVSLVRVRDVGTVVLVVLPAVAVVVRIADVGPGHVVGVPRERADLARAGAVVPAHGDGVALEPVLVSRERLGHPVLPLGRVGGVVALRADAHAGQSRAIGIGHDLHVDEDLPVEHVARARVLGRRDRVALRRDEGQGDRRRVDRLVLHVVVHGARAEDEGGREGQTHRLLHGVSCMHFWFHSIPLFRL